MPLALAILTGTLAFGSAPDTGSTMLRPSDLERVEGRVADLNPLSPAGRHMPANMALPNDFAGVYRIPRSANSPYAGWYARVSGGVIAVFPQSEYAVDKDKGVVPIIPPGTKFLLGGVPLERDRGIDDSRLVRPLGGIVGGPVATRIDLAVAPADPLARAPRTSPEPVQPESAEDRASLAMERLMLDDAYRARRVSSLLSVAARSDAPAPAASVMP